MADKVESKDSAEKAYAEAASKVAEPKPAVKAEPKPAVKKVEAKKAPTKKATAKKAPAKKAPAKKVPVKKAVAKKAPAKVSAKPKTVPATAKKPAAKPTKVAAKKKSTPTKAKPVLAKKASPKPAAPTAAKPSVTELKEKIMATKTADFTDMMSSTMTDAVAEMQTKAQEAYDKGTSLVTEMTEAAKGNVEAVVESGKIMTAGIQDLGKSYADEAKSAYETATADMKEMASVKSPTELFQLQGKIMRRNFDAMVATSSKSSEAAMKLANDVIAPISARVNIAAEKMSKAA